MPAGRLPSSSSLKFAVRPKLLLAAVPSKPEQRSVPPETKLAGGVVSAHEYVTVSIHTVLTIVNGVKLKNFSTPE